MDTRANTRTELSWLQALEARHVLVHYDEIALKGGNRRRFEARLERNVLAALEDLGGVRVDRRYGRLLVTLPGPETAGAACRRLARVFGVARFSPCVRAAADLGEVRKKLAALLESLHRAGARPASFAIVTHRARKDLPFTSVDANRELGAFVQERTGWPVSLAEPELPIHVYFVDRDAFLALERLAGPGGLPTGTAGRVACLISGGIDSPVASYRVLQRGAIPVFVHFHSFPHTTAASQEKVRELVRAILPHGERARLYLVPFAATQERIITRCAPALRVLLYRRYMMRAAEAIARREGALALVTGESLGQVASQTLENLAAIEAATALPVLRPLIGMHKSEIVADARRIGTFEISIEPHEDCCSFLMPRHPATASSPARLDEAERALDPILEVEELVADSAIETVEGGAEGTRAAPVPDRPPRAPPGPDTEAGRNGTQSQTSVERNHAESLRPAR